MSTDKPTGSGDHRPDQTRGPEHKPFPGQPGNRSPVPPPTGTKTADELRADRAKYKTTSEYNAAKTAEKTAAQWAAAKETPAAAKESAAARPGADKTSLAGQDGPEENQVPEGPRSPSSAGPPHTPDSSAAQRGDKGGIRHWHSEFYGQNLDLYTDGTRWVGGDAVQAAQAEAARARAEGRPAPQRHDITDIPQMRDLGRNTVGEKEDRSPGDTSDLPPTGEELVEDADRDKPKMERLKNEVFQEFDDVVGGVKDETDAILNAMSHPRPPGHPEVPVRDGPTIGPQEGHHVAPSPDSVTQAIIVGGVVGYQAVRWADHKITELRRRHDAGHR